MQYSLPAETHSRAFETAGLIEFLWKAAGPEKINSFAKMIVKLESVFGF